MSLSAYQRIRPEYELIHLSAHPRRVGLSAYPLISVFVEYQLISLSAHSQIADPVPAALAVALLVQLAVAV